MGHAEKIKILLGVIDRVFETEDIDVFRKLCKTQGRHFYDTILLEQDDATELIMHKFIALYDSSGRTFNDMYERNKSYEQKNNSFMFVINHPRSKEVFNSMNRPMSEKIEELKELGLY